MCEERFIHKQIAKYATSKKLIEFNDKMKLPPVEYYGHIQATGDKDESGKNQTSLIGIKLLDYTNGTGDKSVLVEANMAPDEIMYVFSKLKQGKETFELLADKIFGTPDEKGRCLVSKLVIKRAPKDAKGNVRNYPWFIQIENGTGVKETRSDNGGIYMKPNSFESTAKVYININDFDMFKLLSRVSSFVSVWELTYAPKRIREAKEIMENAKENRQ